MNAGIDFPVELVHSINDHFQIIESIGDGTYGCVQKCRDLKTNEIVALKRIKIIRADEGFPHNTIREVKLLRQLRHDNIVLLKGVIHVKTERSIYLVFEYCDYDLHALLYMPGLGALNNQLLHSLMRQLMTVLFFLQVRRVVHRDLKPANMFITKNNILKLGDFGLSRELTSNSRYSDNVITLWYRPPELFLGCHNYGPEVDMWSAGCIFYEMITKHPLFVASENNDTKQMQAIMNICGTPDDKDWPEWKNYEKSSIFKPSVATKKPNRLKEHLYRTIPKESHGIIDLLLRMLQMNPRRRITAENAMNHPYFRNPDFEVDPRTLPKLTFPEMHQLKVQETKKTSKSSKEPRPVRPNYPSLF